MSAPREVAPLPSQGEPAVRNDGSTIREELIGLNSIDWSRQLLEGQLPQPRRERWQPLRAGLLNIYLFQDERFPFADGRLLLRGVNATGKSRVLAFLLPFLLEGDLRSTRFEPDRDSTRQVAWNLLMGEHHDRLGYTWLELGRCDPAEGPQFLTLGCGLRAVEDRGIVDHWFFITSQRVDRDLRLVTPQETALTQRQLSEALADKGEIFERAGDYQRAVDDKLFRLGDRFAPLIDLLLQLRQPQLAKKLDLEHLESALRESLPPMSGGLMANAAEAFRSLDADRQRLQASRDSLAHTQSFLAHYRQHVRIGLRRAADGIRNANSSYESASRRLRDNVRQLDDLEVAQQRQMAEGAAVEAQIEALDARIHALVQSDDARAANRLDDKRRMVDDDKATVERFKRAYDQSQRQFHQRQNTVADGEHRVAASLEGLPSAVSAASLIAAPAELAAEHQRRFDGLAGRPGLTSPEVRQAMDILRKETRRWRTLAEQLSAAETAIAEQRTRWRDARRSLEDRERDHDSAASRVIDESSVIDATRASLWTGILQWHGASTELGCDFFDLPAIEISWMKWAEEASGASPLTNVVDEALRRSFATIAMDEAETTHRRTMLQQQQREWQYQLAELRAGVELCPPAPPTRDPVARQAKPGAPLWRMVDFAESVPTSEHAGWEAALEASGLLDAWIESEGRLRDADRNDTILDVSESQDLPFERQLSRVLAPAGGFSESGIARETVDAILRRIGVGTDAGRVWVDKTGHWRNGALTGCWQKEDSQYIGTSARGRHRRRKIEEIEVAVNAGMIEDDSLSDRLEELSARRKRLNDEQRNLPIELPLREALAHWREVERQAAMAELRRREAAELEQREQSGLN
ncbi:MAG TPA: TIGR02680 family protein, partial [Lacipirellulaceae bacterium]|nr:TIGR02680 family protein [Lacipirellulaceae bacterium]